MITDIKAVDIYEWVIEHGESYWRCTSHKIMFLRDGEWFDIRIEHENKYPDGEGKV
jgi:hypothetical protein